MIRLLTPILLAVVLLADPRTADACGEWHMTDVEKQLEINWGINSGVLTRTKTKARIGAIYLDNEHPTGTRVFKGKKIIFDYVGGKFRKYGKVVATLDDNTFTIGKKVFTFELTNQRTFAGWIMAWNLAVKQGDKVIIQSDEAAAFCAAAKENTPVADQQQVIRRRLAFYLLWRELGV